MKNNGKSTTIKLMLLLLVAFVKLTAFSADADSLKTKKDRLPKSISFYYQLGSVMMTHKYVKGQNPYNEPYGMFNAFSLKYGVHTNGNKLWHQLYAYPVYGFGLYKCFYANDYGELGNPAAIYTFIDLPLKRWKKWSLDWEMEFGLGFNWETHELRENNFEYPIGSYSTVFIDGGLNATFYVGKNFDLSAGFSLSHFSNGAIKLPNLGINMMGARFEVRYIFNERPEYKKVVVPEYKKEWEFIALVSPSMRQVGFDYIDENGDTLATAFDYVILSLSATINRQISHKVKFGGGFDINYNESYGADTMMVNGFPQKAPYFTSQKILIGIYPSFELVLGKLSMIAQPGIYVYKKEMDGGFETPTTYQRIGIKYHFWDHMVLGVNIRAFNFSKADFIEFNIGYRIKWQKSYR